MRLTHTPSPVHLLLSFALLLSGGVVVSAHSFGGQQKLTGEKIYNQQCAACHGTKGKGAPPYPRPLVGSYSVGELATFISKTMPPGPKKCTVADSKTVAAYIHEEFYSPLAQARNKPARVELSRLTVRQYRNALADLIGAHRGGATVDQRTGLEGDYFKGRNFNGAQRALKRIDPEINFDYKDKAPTPAQNDERQFAMRWTGSVVAPDTGEYEFVVRTDHATRLHVNDNRTPLIDAWVKSGKDNEYKATVFLLGGRYYPLILEFSKAKQGVDDSEKEKKRPVQPASLSLSWRMPKRDNLEVIPRRCLAPVMVAETFVSTTPFPPDDQSMGYERAASVSQEWHAATTEGALETASYVARRLGDLAGAGEDAQGRMEKVKGFCKSFVERAFRRPLDEPMTKRYLESPGEGVTDPEMYAKRVIILALKSPRFLYREVGTGTQDPFDVASRLSFGLWDTSPDRELLQAAASGELAKPEVALKQADRMAKDPRAWAKLREFFLQWMKVDLYPDLTKNAKAYPGFDAQVASDLRTSFDLFLERIVRSERSDYRELMTTDQYELNSRLASLYDCKSNSASDFEPVQMDKSGRSGILTHPYVLASFAYTDHSSPIHRGVLIAKNLLGRVLMPPKVSISPVAADLHPKLTTRQRVAMQTKPEACMSCHSMINPLGFTLERFDAIGKARDMEKGVAVDSSGGYLARTGKWEKFAGPRDLSKFLADSDESRGAFVERLFQYLIKQPVLAYGPNTLPDLKKAFEQNEWNIRKLMAQSVALASIVR